MYAIWLSKRLYIKDIITQIITPKSSYDEIFTHLKKYNVENDEFNTYKSYIADLIYEHQMKEYFQHVEPKFKLADDEKLLNHTKFNLNDDNKKLNNTLNITELYVDGSCIPGISAKGYARVTDQKGSPLLHLFNLSDYKYVKYKTPKGEVDAVEVYSEDTPNQQINYAEITALHLGLRIALSLDIKKINIDSVTSNAWSSGRISKSIKDPEKLRICKEAINFRSKFEKEGGIIFKIDGGKNLADFGLHK